MTNTLIKRIIFLVVVYFSHYKYFTTMLTINQNIINKTENINDAMFGFFPFSFLFPFFFGRGVGVQGMFDLILLMEIVQPRLHFSCNLCFIKGRLNKKMHRYNENFNN